MLSCTFTVYCICLDTVFTCFSIGFTDVKEIGAPEDRNQAAAQGAPAPAPQAAQGAPGAPAPAVQAAVQALAAVAARGPPQMPVPAPRRINHVVQQGPGMAFLPPPPHFIPQNLPPPPPAPVGYHPREYK